MSAKTDRLRNRLSINPDDPPPTGPPQPQSAPGETSKVRGCTRMRPKLTSHGATALTGRGAERQPPPEVPTTNIFGMSVRDLARRWRAGAAHRRSVRLSWRDAIPPVDRFTVGAHPIEDGSDHLDVCATAAGPAEFPQFTGCPMVVVDRFIDGVGVGLAAAVAVDSQSQRGR